MSKKSVDFHVKNDDYFGTLATVLSLVRQNIEKNKTKSILCFKALDNSVEELMYLKGKYKIIKK